MVGTVDFEEASEKGAIVPSLLGASFLLSKSYCTTKCPKQPKA